MFHVLVSVISLGVLSPHPHPTPGLQDLPVYYVGVTQQPHPADPQRNVSLHC